MDTETKQILREQVELLKKINKHFLYQRVWGTIKNIVIIGFIIFSALQLQPYLEGMLSFFTGIDQNLSQPLDINKLLKQGGF